MFNKERIEMLEARVKSLEQRQEQFAAVIICVLSHFNLAVITEPAKGEAIRVVSFAGNKQKDKNK